jgi:hypothetical protein
VLHYHLVFYDAEGNSASTQQNDITITDNEPGSISNDVSDTTGREGETFHFQIDASDNVGVSDVYTVYWFGDDESTKVLLPLTGVGGTYSGSFTPSDHGTLHYYFLVVDDEGNEFQGPGNTASILGPGEETEGQEQSVIPWILVVILIIVVLILLFLLMRKKGEEPEAIPAEAEEEGEVDEEFGREGLDEDLVEESREELEGELDEIYKEDLEEGRFEDLEKVPGVEDASEEIEDEMVHEEEIIEETEEASPEEEDGSGKTLGQITCPNCGIASSADLKECPICRTKFE